MKKDIPFLPVEGIQVVVARKLSELNEYDWQVFLINQNEQPIHTVFVTSRGYGRERRRRTENGHPSVTSSFPLNPTPMN